MDSSGFISDYQRDLLKELANIGVGNAMTALSTMMEDQRIDMQVPVVKIEPLQNVPDAFGDPEDPVAATFCLAESPELGLVIVFVMSLEAARNLVTKIMPAYIESDEDMERSLLMELGNIITGAYLNALSFMTGLTIQSSPPRLGVDMAGAILGTVIAETMTVDDQLILLQTELAVANEEIGGTVLILPDSGSLASLFNFLGNS